MDGLCLLPFFLAHVSLLSLLPSQWKTNDLSSPGHNRGIKFLLNFKGAYMSSVLDCQQCLHTLPSPVSCAVASESGFDGPPLSTAARGSGWLWKALFHNWPPSPPPLFSDVPSNKMSLHLLVFDYYHVSPSRTLELCLCFSYRSVCTFTASVNVPHTCLGDLKSLQVGFGLTPPLSCQLHITSGSTLSTSSLHWSTRATIKCIWDKAKVQSISFIRHSF